MSKYIFLLVAMILFAPIYAISAPVPGSPQVVEEPEDAPIPESPANDFAKEPASGKTKDKTASSAKKTVPEKPPGDNLEGGFNTVILQGLNKVTARASRIEAVIGSTVRFGTLEIVARSCWKSAPEDRPENAVLLEVSEIKQGEPSAKVFLGWMFSSSPGLSSLEHPFYDITVVKCDKSEGGKL